MGSREGKGEGRDTIADLHLSQMLHLMKGKGCKSSIPTGGRKINPKELLEEGKRSTLTLSRKSCYLIRGRGRKEHGSLERERARRKKVRLLSKKKKWMDCFESLPKKKKRLTSAPDRGGDTGKKRE